jgi:hypothetical protein
MATSHVNAKGQTMYSDDSPGSWKGDIFVPADAPPPPGGTGPNDPTNDDPAAYAKGGVVRSTSIKPKKGFRNYAKSGAVKGYDDGGPIYPQYQDRQGAIQGGQRVDLSRPSDMSEAEWMSLDSTEALKKEVRQREAEASNPNTRKGLYK